MRINVKECYITIAMTTQLDELLMSCLLCQLQKSTIHSGQVYVHHFFFFGILPIVGSVHQFVRPSPYFGVGASICQAFSLFWGRCINLSGLLPILGSVHQFIILHVILYCASYICTPFSLMSFLYSNCLHSNIGLSMSTDLHLPRSNYHVFLCRSPYTC